MELGPQSPCVSPFFVVAMQKLSGLSRDDELFLMLERGGNQRALHALWTTKFCSPGQRYEVASGYERLRVFGSGLPP
jgi:hypothetical protein